MLRSSCVHFKGYEDGENYCERMNVACFYNCPTECKFFYECDGKCLSCTAPVGSCENKVKGPKTRCSGLDMTGACYLCAHRGDEKFCHGEV